MKASTRQTFRYLSVGEPCPAVGIDMGDGVVLRYDEETQEVAELTVVELQAQACKSRLAQRLFQQAIVRTLFWASAETLDFSFGRPLWKRPETCILPSATKNCPES
jgi:hypothetical protein